MEASSKSYRGWTGRIWGALAAMACNALFFAVFQIAARPLNVLAPPRGTNANLALIADTVGIWQILYLGLWAFFAGRRGKIDFAAGLAYGAGITAVWNFIYLDPFRIFYR